VWSEYHKKPVGAVFLWDINFVDRTAAIRIMIGPDFQKHGFGERAIRDVANYAFSVLNLYKAYAYVFDFNTASAKAFEKAGFDKEAVLRNHRYVNGKMRDVVLYSMFKGGV